MSEIQELMAKLLLLQDGETHDITELISNINVTKDVLVVMDFRERCVNAKNRIMQDNGLCKTDAERESWLSQCNCLIDACDQSLQRFSQETIIEKLQAFHFKKLIKKRINTDSRQ